MDNPYVDEITGDHYGYCNSCGEEASLYTETCDNGCDGGEVVPYDDDPDPYDQNED
jgi:hypothetical protein